MKAPRKIIIVDPKPSLLNLTQSLWEAGFHIQEIFSEKCDETIFKNLSDLSEIRFCLSGTDRGISLSDTINKKLNYSGEKPSNIFYNKIDQQAFIQKYAPELAFENAQVFDSLQELEAYLSASNQRFLVRPEVSNKNGSGILFSNNFDLIKSDLSDFFNKSKRVLTHSFVPGKSYFLNGLILDGNFFGTDAWECFNLIANERNILVSVINVSLNQTIIKKTTEALSPLIKKLKLKFCPIHFEFVVTEEKIKIVKFVTRLATEPLPTLCTLAGSKSQMDFFQEALTGVLDPTNFIKNEETSYVADYSFIVKKPGFLQNLLFDKINTLPSYYHSYCWPAIGSYLSKTVCGATYGATFLFKNKDRNALLADIEYCQDLNKRSVFDIASFLKEEENAAFNN